MMLGMSLATFTTVHVIISLVAIVAGLIAVLALMGGRLSAGWTAIFLLFTVLTSVTGFMFPRGPAVTPAQVLGGVSLAILLIAIAALYAFHLARAWRWVYVVTALLALYFNLFVLVVQAFQKLAFLQALAPTQSEAPFVAAQIALIVLMVVLGFLAVRSFRPEQTRITA